MSPAPVIPETQQNPQLQTLAKAFEALLLTVHQLNDKERSLQQRLKYANEQYSKLADRIPGGTDTHTKIVAEKILRCSPDPIPPHEQSLKASDVVNTLAESGHVGEPIINAIREGLDCYQSVPRPPDDNLLTNPNPCVVATRADTPARLEKDFTTKGTQGSLRCPFAKLNNKASENGALNGVEDAFDSHNYDACGHDVDPIKAEKNERRSSQAGSARSSTARCPISKCPIRFLDQHTPEEVAEYVERHKHEIPRSHAICVSRYQRDSSSMRHLDAKYGNLISMIRGLSVKHQAFLPGAENGASGSSSSAERVEKWAEDVGRTPKQEMHPTIKEEEGEGHQEEERQGHFDRPLRDIRLGESPSRPWGIPVPIPLDPLPTSPLQSPPAPVPPPQTQSNKPPDHAVTDEASVAPLQETTPNESDAAPPPRRCPFGHGAPKPPAPKPEPKPEKIEPETQTIRNDDIKGQVPDAANDPGEPPDGPQPNNSKPSAPANIVFNGPVFFGFSPEQTAVFLQQLQQLGGLGQT